MKKQLSGLFRILVMAISACKKDAQSEIAMEYPEIDITGSHATLPNAPSESGRVAND